MKKYLWISLLPVVVVVALLGSGFVALAQSKTLYWQRYDVNINVQQNGDMLVEEIQEIVFTNGTFTFGFAAIPLDRVEQITDVGVSEIINGQERPYTPNSTAEYGFTTAVTDNELEITWYFPPTSNSTHTYVLSYRVIGGLRIYPEGDQVWWKAIPPDHNFTIQSATVMVMPPQTFSKDQLLVEAYGAPVDNVSYTDRGAVVFQASDIGAGEELEVRVQFPHGVVQAEPPDWQTADDLYRSLGPVVGILSGALGLFLLVGSPIAVYALWFTRGRDVDEGAVPEYISDPPSSLPAAVVGTLIDEHADLKDIIASIFDLAQRGAVRMEEKENLGSLGMSRDFVFHLEDEKLAVYPHEKRLLKHLFGHNGKERRLYDLRQKFYSAIPPLKRDLYQQVVNEGFFPSSPETTRQKWLWLALGGLVLSIGGSCFLLLFLSNFSAAVVCPGFGLAAGMAALALVSRHMPRKTSKGAEEGARWLAFKKYLENIEEYSDLEGVKDRFQEYLPYAVAFGLEKRLIRKFSAVDAPAPTWWGPVIIMPHRRGVYGMPSGQPSSPTGGPPGPLAGDAGGVPSLSSMSEGVGSSLASMSEGLGALLNSASSTLTSTPPPPKSSSSGGWSGGGWSGGGGFSGGGGGGGSRGFG